MMTPATVSALPFGERTDLLAKHMRYGLSLEFQGEATGIHLIVTPGPGDATKPGSPGFRHLFDEKLVTMPEGGRVDIPACQILSGRGQLGTAKDPRCASFVVDMNTVLDDGKPMNLTCRGVVTLRGGSSALRSPSATVSSGHAFVATTCETVSATYRWITRRELFGVGAVRGTRSLAEADPTTLTKKEHEVLLSGKPWRLHFSFDLYAAF